jgi:hypothetical protein
MPSAQEEKRFTCRDYLGWPENERWGIMGGKAYHMTPAPSTLHQRILVRMAGLLEKAPEGNRSTLFVVPTDVNAFPWLPWSSVPSESKSSGRRMEGETLICTGGRGKMGHGRNCGDVKSSHSSLSPPVHPVEPLA